MTDFQKGDIVETNEDATFELRLTATVGDPLPEGKSRHFSAGERGMITAIQYDKDEPFLVFVHFDDGTDDNLYADWLDLVYRPINDPAQYAHGLFDEEQGA